MFLKDLANLPSVYREKIEKLVFEEIPKLDNISDARDIKKMLGLQKIGKLRNKIVLFMRYDSAASGSYGNNACSIQRLGKSGGIQGICKTARVNRLQACSGWFHAA
jgi:hypothetical protein